jgi:hypothetical protein
MSAVRVGVLLAAVVAGPPLYELVQTGGLDADSGLLRYALVAAACALGAGWIAGLMRDYEADARRRRREALIDEARKALEVQQGAPGDSR